MPHLIYSLAIGLCGQKVLEGAVIARAESTSADLQGAQGMGFDGNGEISTIVCGCEWSIKARPSRECSKVIIWDARKVQERSIVQEEGVTAAL